MKRNWPKLPGGKSWLILFGLSLNSIWAAGPQLATESLSSTSFLIAGNGELNSWGYGGYGTLGNGSCKNQSAPVTVAFPSGVNAWKSVSGSEYASFAISDNNQLYGWGFINMPPYTNTSPLVPIIIQAPDGAGWTAVAAGKDAWLGLTSLGHLYGWRNGYAGMIQYPSPPTGTRWTKAAIGYDEILTLADSGRLYSHRIWVVGWQLTEVSRPAGTTAWTDISSGQYFNLGVADDGNVYSWGYNYDGELGIGVKFPTTNSPQRVLMPDGVTGWKTIAAGNGHSLALCTNGQVYAWGGNWYGQLGIGSTTNQTLPVPAPGLANVTAIAVGQDYSLVVAGCGVLGFGVNSAGQLGTGTNTAFETLPVASSFIFDICSTNSSLSPVVSINVIDDSASEGSYRSHPGHTYTNTALFRISRLVPTTSSLLVNYSVSGTASNGVDFLSLSGTATIPASRNSISILIVPTQDTLPASPETIAVSLLPDTAYNLRYPTNVLITLSQFEYSPSPPLPFQLPLGTNQVGQTFLIQASTNLIKWETIATVTNINGTASFIESNSAVYESRFYRVTPGTNP
jgi:alpha-tubulin suppressor-like RCC1 family protein